MFIARGCKRTKSVKITPNKKKKHFFLGSNLFFFLTLHPKNNINSKFLTIMKQKLLFTIIALLAIVLKSQAGIVITEQVIDLQQLNIKLVGENTENNFRYTINNYEWADRGPQFQLVIEPIDNTKSAQFTSSDLSDENYWEPLFRRITKEMAGQEMEAQYNIKKIFVKNVALLNNQFFDYEDNGYIQIESSGDFTIPDGCFSEDTHLKTFVCNVAGILTLGTNIVDTQPGFTVKVYTTQSANAWKTYRENTGANFIVDDSEAGSGIRGDLNNDGVIDMSDVMYLVQKILNGKFPDE